MVRSGPRRPTHLHAVEEVLTVLEGKAEMWLEDERTTLSAGQSMIVPAGRKHGFRNIGETTLHVQAILAAPIFEATFDDPSEVRRRWLPPPLKGSRVLRGCSEIERRVVDDFLHDEKGARLADARQRDQLLAVQPVEIGDVADADLEEIVEIAGDQMAIED